MRRTCAPRTFTTKYIWDRNSQTSRHPPHVLLYTHRCTTFLRLSCVDTSLSTQPSTYTQHQNNENQRNMDGEGSDDGGWTVRSTIWYHKTKIRNEAREWLTISRMGYPCHEYLRKITTAHLHLASLSRHDRHTWCIQAVDIIIGMGKRYWHSHGQRVSTELLFCYIMSPFFIDFDV